MHESSFLSLIQNIAILLASAILFDLAATRRWTGKNKIYQVLLGVSLGVVGIVLMLTPWVYADGIIFDTRSVLLGVSGLFFGPIPTLIAIAITAVFRITQGGTAAVMGVSVITVTGLAGIAWRFLRRRSLVDITWRELYLFGIVIHLFMLALTFTMPFQTAIKVFNNIALPVIIIYPLGTALLGSLMTNRLRREKTTEALQDSQEKLSLAITASNIGFFSRNFQTNETYYSLEWKKQIGYEDQEIANNNDEWQKRVHPDDLAMVLDRINTCIQNHKSDYEAEYRFQHKDGSYRWILARGLIQFSPKGQPHRLVGCHIDITRQKQNEAAISASERRFRGLAESSLDYIMLYDREFCHVYMNPAALQISGMVAEDIIGKTHREAGFSEELSEMWENDIQQVFNQAISLQRMFEWESSQGKLFLDWRLSPVFGADGQVELVLGISRDITALKMAEQALEKSKEQYRVLTESIQDVVWILDTQTMYFRYVSPSVERLRGYTPEEIMAVHVDQSLTPDSSDNVILLIQTRAQAFLTGEIGPDQFFTDEVEQPCKDGSSVWTEVITNFYRNPDNDHIEVRGVTRDIQGRKNAAEALRESEAKYRIVAENTYDWEYWVDATQNFVYCSPSCKQTTGYAPEDFFNDPFLLLKIIYPDDLPIYQQHQCCHPDGETKQIEFRIVCSDGSIRWIGHVCQPIFEQSKFIGIRGSNRDITERQIAEENVKLAQAELELLLKESDQSRLTLLSVVEDQKRAEEHIQQLNADLEQRVRERTALLEAANKELEAFAYSVSHDLRAPLRALDGFSSALLNNYQDSLDEQGQHYLSRIQEASRRMGQLINDLLNLSRVTRADFNRQRVDLSQIAAEVVKELQTQNPQRNVEFIIADDLIVQGDTRLLRIVLENLLNNAFKFTSHTESARIQFGHLQKNGKRIFFIRDNGVGFDMAYATKLFAPFQRLHGMNEFPGTGIGLVTVQRIIQRHGGRIWPEAEIDLGATFYFTLGENND